MRRECLLAVFLFAAARLAAWDGTPLTWLDGTQPWDSTPMDELDVQALGGGGDGHGQAGLGAQWGVLDELQAAGQWSGPVPGAGNASGELDLRLREPYFPELRPAFSVYDRAPFVDGGWQEWAGLAADWEPLETDLAANAETGDGGHERLRLAFWTPYLVTTLRLGMEASWLDAASEAYTPQLLINAPGDLSLQAGLRVDPRDGSRVWMARLSYELFPNP